MWWPSFVEVMQDLWFFLLGKPTGITTLDHAKTQTNTEKTAGAFPPPRTAAVKLEENQLYDASHFGVIKIREKLAAYDYHLVQKTALTMREWLLYVVHVKRPTIPLLALQMTPIGSWYVTLKGQSGVSIGISPYCGALMEWGSGDQTGNVALVQKVTPEETITWAQLGETKPGQYTTQTMVKKDWLELRPVFTTVA